VTNSNLEVSKGQLMKPTLKLALMNHHHWNS
jgi:hypothetical protein